MTPANEAAVCALRVAPGQDLFTDGVAASLEEAKRSPDAHPWVSGDLRRRSAGWLRDAVLRRAARPPDYPWRYFLWRLLINAEDGVEATAGLGLARRTEVLRNG
jgi:hypothetical protein